MMDYDDHIVHTIEEESFWVCVDNKFTAHGTNEEDTKAWENFLDDDSNDTDTTAIPGDKYRDPYLEYEKPLHVVFGGSLATNHIDVDEPHYRTGFDRILNKARSMPYEVSMLTAEEEIGG